MQKARWLLILIVIPVASGFGFSRQDQQTPRLGSALSVRTQMVQVYLSVRDGTRTVPELGVADFSLKEDSREKEIERVDSGKDPLNVALLLDVSESMRNALPLTEEAAVSFVESLDPKDRVTLVSFSSDIRYVAQQSDDRTSILQAIRGSHSHGETKLFEAVLFAMKYLSGREGRRAIVIFSDGEDTARGASLDLVLNAAGRYGFPIYTIGAGAGLEQDSLKRVLRRIADINGGRTFYVEDLRELRAAFLEVAAEVRSAYVLTYYTDVPVDGRWHDIEIRTSNPRFTIQSRKGFYAQTAGSASLFGGSPAGKGPALPSGEGSQTWNDDEVSKQAVNKILEPAPDARPLDTAQSPDAGAQSRAPVFKVEARFVEVPVLLECDASQKIPELSQKDFRIYEDDVLQELAFFAKADEPRNLSQLRDAAMAKIRSGDAPGGVAATPASDLDKLVLGRYYLVLDDLMTESGAYLQAKVAAEKIIRTYSSPVRPMSLFFTSEGQPAAPAGNEIETMLQRVRSSMPRATRELTSTVGIMSIHEAYLIESNDVKALQLAELQFASSMDMRYENSLGSVDGDVAADQRSIDADIQSRSRELIAINLSQVSRILGTLRNIVALAAADQGSYPKTLLFISSGFSLGRLSTRADASAQMGTIINAARRAGLHAYTIDATGLDAPGFFDISNAGSLVAHNPFLAPLFEDHAEGWRRERESSLSQLASETGGRFLHLTNDLVGAVGTAIRNTGRLFYIGYLSRQPADGQYHRIRVSVSARVARVQSRTGYFAGRQSAPEGIAGDLEEQDTRNLLARADAARKEGNHQQLALVFDQLVRRNPGDANMWYNLGVARLRSKDFERAVQALKTSLSLAPDDQDIGRVLARAFVESGAREAAAETLELMLRRSPHEIQTIIQLGLVYESTARLTDAYNAYRRALDLTSSPPLDLYLSLIRTAIRLGRGAEANLLMEDYLAKGGSEVGLKPFRTLLSPNPH
jgi:VWFA-related protein